MNRKTVIIFLVFITFLASAVAIKLINKTRERIQKETSTESVKKSKLTAHYGRSGEVELLKTPDNIWQLVNYNGYFVTIRHVTVSTAYGVGEITKSVQRIGAKGSINLKNLSLEDGFYIYDSYGALTGWLRANEIHYLTEPL